MPHEGIVDIERNEAVAEENASRLHQELLAMLETGQLFLSEDNIDEAKKDACINEILQKLAEVSEADRVRAVWRTARGQEIRAEMREQQNMLMDDMRSFMKDIRSREEEHAKIREALTREESRLEQIEIRGKEAIERSDMFMEDLRSRDVIREDRHLEKEVAHNEHLTMWQRNVLEIREMVESSEERSDMFMEDLRSRDVAREERRLEQERESTERSNMFMEDLRSGDVAREEEHAKIREALTREESRLEQIEIRGKEAIERSDMFMEDLRSRDVIREDRHLEKEVAHSEHLTMWQRNVLEIREMVESSEERSDMFMEDLRSRDVVREERRLEQKRESTERSNMFGEDLRSGNVARKERRLEMEVAHSERLEQRRAKWRSNETHLGVTETSECVRDNTLASLEAHASSDLFKQIQHHLRELIDLVKATPVSVISKARVQRLLLSTNELLDCKDLMKRRMLLQAYQVSIRDLPGHPSPWMRALGAVVMALSIALMVSVGCMSAALPIGLVGFGAGVFFFKKGATKQHSLYAVTKELSSSLSRTLPVVDMAGEQVVKRLATVSPADDNTPHEPTLLNVTY